MGKIDITTNVGASINYLRILPHKLSSLKSWCKGLESIIEINMAEDIYDSSIRILIWYPSDFDAEETTIYSILHIDLFDERRLDEAIKEALEKIRETQKRMSEQEEEDNE